MSELHFQGQMMFHCRGVLHFIYISVTVPSGCFHFLFLMNNSTITIHAQDLTWMYAYSVGNAGPIVGLLTKRFLEQVTKI